MAAFGNNVKGSTCNVCGNFKVIIEISSTSGAHGCTCARTDITNPTTNKDLPIKITSVEQYLKYKDESKPSKIKRLKSRAKRKKRKR